MRPRELEKEIVGDADAVSDDYVSPSVDVKHGTMPLRFVDEVGGGQHAVSAAEVEYAFVLAGIEEIDQRHAEIGNEAGIVLVGGRAPVLGRRDSHVSSITRNCREFSR